MASSLALDTEPRLRRDWTAYAPLDASGLQQARAAASDVAEGFRRHRAWRYLATEQVKNQYRRTVLGPWWLTLQTTLYVVGLASIFGALRHTSLKSFLPYFAIGFLTFALLSGLTRASANVFIAQASSIKSTRQPLTSLVLRAVTIELIQFGHNIIIVIAFYAFQLINITPWLALAPVGLLIMLVNGVAFGLWLGPTVARFRDVSPAVDSVLQVIVFFTPVFYKTEDLHGAQRALIEWNPYTYFIDFFRDAITGVRPSLMTGVGTLGFTAVNLLLAMVVFSRSRSRLPYWVA